MSILATVESRRDNQDVRIFEINQEAHGKDIDHQHRVLLDDDQVHQIIVVVDGIERKDTLKSVKGLSAHNFGGEVEGEPLMKPLEIKQSDFTLTLTPSRATARERLRMGTRSDKMLY